MSSMTEELRGKISEKVCSLEGQKLMRIATILLDENYLKEVTEFTDNYFRAKDAAMSLWDHIIQWHGGIRERIQRLEVKVSVHFEPKVEEFTLDL